MKIRSFKTILTPENEKNYGFVNNALTKDGHFIYKSGTGLGKTYTIGIRGCGEIALENEEYLTQILVITPGDGTRDQWIETIKNVDPRFEQGKTEKYNKPFCKFEIEKEDNHTVGLKYVFVTYSWLHFLKKNKGLAFFNFLKEFDMFICDECHRAGAPEWSKPIKYLLTNKAFKDKPVIGLTADPVRYSSGSNYNAVVDMWKDNIVNGTSVREAIERRILKAPFFSLALVETRKSMRTAFRRKTIQRSITIIFSNTMH